MPAGPHAEFSFLTLLVLLGVVGLSCLTFWLLVRRATSHRRWVALSDWARARGFRYHPIDGGQLPEPFTRLGGAQAMARLWLAGPSMELVQMEPGSVPLPAAATDAAKPPMVEVAPKPWHVLIRQVETNWPPTALRPQSTAASESTVLDQFGLASFPSMITSDRFVIFGADSPAARTLSKSKLPALLPPDVGLLLHGRRMVLDFSDRPFDTIEFDRMIALANHLVGHLPALGKAS